MYLDLFGEGCAEHHGLSDAFVRHGVLFHDASYLWLEPHVQHAICLIQDQVAKVRRRQAGDEEDVILSDGVKVNHSLRFTSYLQ